jgi:hypothetical protein
VVPEFSPVNDRRHAKGDFLARRERSFWAVLEMAGGRKMRLLLEQKFWWLLLQLLIILKEKDNLRILIN